jgi:hypothetical protein
VRRILAIVVASLAASAAPACAQIAVTYDPAAHSIRIQGDSAIDDIYVEEVDTELAVTNP